MKFIVVAYYTKNTIYEAMVEKFIESVKRHNVPHYVQAIENKGDWYKNTNYKPTFLKGMLLKYPGFSIVYVDIDAEFLKYPVLFETFDYDIGVHVFDRSCYSKSHQGFEVLSGTIFLRNNMKVYELVERWERECRANPKKWDQRSLEAVLEGDYGVLPGEYCKIFDRWSDVITDPVIVHYQASREVRRNKGKILF